MVDMQLKIDESTEVEKQYPGRCGSSGCVRMSGVMRNKIDWENGRQ